ncbi:MAG: NADH-quinone oxidoreductase subunit N [Desulfobulbus sp.]|jgi:NADH-quinone oxidoreductase subunit N
MTNDFMLLFPVILVSLGAIGLMLAATCRCVQIEQAAWACGGLFGFAFLVQLAATLTGDQALYSSLFNDILVVSPFSKAASLVILGCGLFTVCSSLSYFKKNNFSSTEYYSLLLFAASGMLLLTMTRELISTFIALEIMSLAIYILVGYDRDNVLSTEAVMKYLILGAFAGAFLTMGSAFVYGAAGSTKFALIGNFVATTGFLSNPAILAGSFFILVALLFKAAAFPFHAWVLDVYDGASMPITGFMATALKTAIFAVFANFLLADSGLQQGWVTFLFYIAILSMFMGNFIAIGQSSLKRMLAASGIVHSGYLLIGLVALGSQPVPGSVVAFYLAAYAAGTLGIFSALSYLSGKGEQWKNFDDFKGLAKTKPYTAFAISIFLLSMAGIPPTAGFMGKLYIILAAIQAGQITLAVLGIVSSIVAMWYYLRLIVTMYFHAPERSFAEECPSRIGTVSTLVLVLCVFAISLYPIAL